MVVHVGLARPQQHKDESDRNWDLQDRFQEDGLIKSDEGHGWLLQKLHTAYQGEMFGAELITGVSCTGLPLTAETRILEVPTNPAVMYFLQTTDAALNFTLRTAPSASLIIHKQCYFL